MSKLTTKVDHDRLARRLVDILQRFNMGETLDIDELATEYSVHRRTIQRDLHERFDFLAIERMGKRYALDAAFLGKFTFKDIERFAALAGLKGLFPALDRQFFTELLDTRLPDALNVHSANYEDLAHRRGDFRLLQRAIAERRCVGFFYDKEGSGKHVEVHPYRLINHAGIWYLAAVDAGQLKSYAFGKVRAPEALPARFTLDSDVVQTLDNEDSIWLNLRKTEVVLTIAPAAAVYFRRRKLIAQQTTIKDLDDGGMMVSGKFAHPDQILPIVRYWIPHVRIVSPVGWQKELEETLRAYLDV